VGEREEHYHYYYHCGDYGLRLIYHWERVVGFYRCIVSTGTTALTKY